MIRLFRLLGVALVPCFGSGCNNKGTDFVGTKAGAEVSVTEASSGCERLALPEFDATGSRQQPGGPQVAVPQGLAYRLNVAAQGSTLTASSQSFGPVNGHSGSGLWCLASLQGEGSNSGVLSAGGDGSYQQAIPLFCGEQRLKIAWFNSQGMFTQVFDVSRSGCERADLRATLSWGVGANDLEMHLIRAGGKINNGDGSANDCTWTSCIAPRSPDWGAPGQTVDNPRKDLDWTRDRGAENIYLVRAERGTYRLMVEYWGGGGPASPTVTLNLGGKTQVHSIPQLLPRQVWSAASIAWPEGKVDLHSEVIDCSRAWRDGCRLPIP